jgi:hypothetical protein
MVPRVHSTDIDTRPATAMTPGSMASVLSNHDSPNPRTLPSTQGFVTKGIDRKDTGIFF